MKTIKPINQETNLSNTPDNLLKTFEDITEKGKLEVELAETNNELIEQKWQFFIDTVNSIADPFVILDEGYCFKYITPKYASFYGKTQEELTGKNYWKAFPELINSTFYQYCCKAMTEKIPVHFEFKGVFSETWFENHFHPLKDGLVAYCSNITKRKHAEIELEKSRQETIEILESIGDCFISLDEGLQYIYVNQAAENFLGSSQEFLMGRQILNCCPNLPPLVLEKLCQVHREKTQQHFEFLSQPLGKWVECSVYPANRGISMYFQDITERKEAEEALRQSEERFQKIFHNSPDMILIFRADDFEILEANQKLLEVLGFNREEVIGCSLVSLNIITEEFRRQEICKQLSSGGTLSNQEVELCSKTGEKIITLTSTDIINIDGESCYLSVIKNITREKKFEAHMARLNQLHLIGEMAAGIGHEVRNPMTTVRGFLQLFQEEEAFAKYNGRLKLMIDELDRANGIITEFLTLAKNKTSVQQKQQLNKIIEAIFPLLQADAMKNDKYISLELGSLPELMLDEKEIRQLIHNLVRNGLEAIGPRGCVTITTFLDGERAILNVRDEGMGITPEVLKKIGTPFFTTKDMGTGLGLPMCFSIADRHGAFIDIASSPLGTTVSVRFKVI